METKTSNPKKNKTPPHNCDYDQPRFKKIQISNKLNLKRVPLIKANVSPALNACKAIAYGTWYTTGSTIFFLA